MNTATTDGIVISDSVTRVTFALDGLANIGVVVGKRKLLMKEVRPNPEGRPGIGDNMEEDALRKYPQVEFVFEHPASIDVLVRELRRLKEDMNRPPSPTYSAC